MCPNPTYPYISSSSSPSPCAGLSTDGFVGGSSPLAGAGEGAAAAAAGAASAAAGVASAAGVAASPLVATGAVGAAAGTGATGAATGVDAAAGAWKAGCIPAPISFRRRFAASASFLSHAKYACYRKGTSIPEHPPDGGHTSIVEDQPDDTYASWLAVRVSRCAVSYSCEPNSNAQQFTAIHSKSRIFIYMVCQVNVARNN